jgi:hypothetical protein
MAKEWMLGIRRYSRWVVLSVAIGVEINGGAQYAFGIFSDLLKSHFKLTQRQLDNIGIYKLS